MRNAIFVLTVALAAHSMQAAEQGSQTANSANNAWLCQNLKDDGKSLCQSQSSVTFAPKPEPIKPTAKGMDLVDGAIVCPSMDEANWLFGQINMARHARLSLSLELRRQAALVNGYDEGDEPKPSDYRCQFVPTGTPMNVKMEMGVIPTVWGTMKDGRPFSGVTIPDMIDR